MYVIFLHIYPSGELLLALAFPKWLLSILLIPLMYFSLGCMISGCCVFSRQLCLNSLSAFFSKASKSQICYSCLFLLQCISAIVSFFLSDFYGGLMKSQQARWGQRVLCWWIMGLPRGPIALTGFIGREDELVTLYIIIVLKLLCPCLAGTCPRINVEIISEMNS